jgi:HTH-type transcriptional repressor of NAD biosynthesis genes
MIQKIVFIGPESSGKTTLCKKLAENFKIQWVPEACRLAAEKKQVDPNNIDFQFTLEEFQSMAYFQNEMEYNLQKQSDKLLICDNDSFSLTIWCERYLGKYYDEIYKIYEDAKHLNNSEKIYILTKPNVPFIQDGYRDGEHIRDWMYERFIEELNKYNMKYYLIESSDYEERYNKAIEIIKTVKRI